jgi:hypothetical protein
MEPHRFDILTRRLGIAGSRRQALTAFIAGTFAHLAGFPEVDRAAGACKGFKAKCKSKSSCCGGLGLRCRKDRCRCKKGWQRCADSGKGCTHVKTDPGNCGSCGNECPPATPCCIGGKCEATCGGSCCASCFIDHLGIVPQPATATCCQEGAGNFCSSKKHNKSDDECCYPDQDCVNGHCCCDGCQGAVICGGKCCPAASCCNGKCCAEGQVCGTTTEGLACVAADRQCAGDDDCLAGEECRAGTCCSGDRICGDGEGGEACCEAGYYCDDSLGLNNSSCCPINTTCHSTWRGHRVRR